MKSVRQLYYALILAVFLLSYPAFAQGPRSDQMIEAPVNVDPYHDVRESILRFQTIYRQLSDNYVDVLNPEPFMEAGIQGLLSTLDPYTEYYQQEETDDLQIMTRGRYGGLGIHIGIRGEDRVLTVISPMEGTPAWRAGLRPNDYITHINGESTEGFTTRDAANRMRGDPGTTVNITISRAGEDNPIEYTIERETIQVNDISYTGFIEPGVGYIRLSRFSRNAGTNVADEIRNLLNQGMEQLVFDLRGNPGGLLPEAISVAENFLPDSSLVVSTRGRIPQSNREFYSRGEPSLPMSVPLVVLVNEGSASASEIVAGAIQDHDRGVVIGQPTFGKGLVQSVITFQDSSALKLTTAKYYTPSGRLIQKADYFDENESLLHQSVDGMGNELGDTLFFTDNGRQVIAHGGIVPDILVETTTFGEASLELWRQGMFYSFASYYYNEHPDQEAVPVTDEMLNDFMTYLDEREFEFETSIERHLSAIREELEAPDANASEQFLAELEDLEELAAVERRAMFDDEEEIIRQRLDIELALVKGGLAARVEESLKFDPQVLEAVEVLNRYDTYVATLSGDGMLIEAPILDD